jgi:hypothetical protein
VADEVRLWRIGSDDTLGEIKPGRLDLESRLEEWLKRDISVLDPSLLIIGNQVATVGGPLDLLCIDAAGDLVILELKRDKTPREIIAQALDYASWVVGLPHERVISIADAYLGEGVLQSRFRERFGSELPETLNGDHRMVIVGSGIDARSERIIRYLSETHGIRINAATFHYFRDADGSELVARIFLIEPSEAELSASTRGTSRRRPNLTDEQLEELATKAGVDQLYDHAVRVLSQVLQRTRSRSSMTFSYQLKGSRKALIRLEPGESSRETGLSYKLYRNRFSEVSRLSSEDATAVLPAERAAWNEGYGPEYEGYQGFIVSREEVDRLAGALPQSG